jgi:hypothetical protein
MPKLSDQQSRDVKVMIGMMSTIVVPIAITLATIRTPRPAVALPADPALNPSPYGYTWSLLMFVVPDVVLGYWVLAMHRGRKEKQAFWLTLAVLVPVWCLLDVFLGLTFFTFPNTAATIGHVWGYTFSSGWQRGIPVEEFGFYVFGFISMLLVYIWSDEYLLKAYDTHNDMRREETRKLIAFHPKSLVIGVILFAIAWAYKAYGPHDDHAGFPGYFAFVLASTVVPSLMFYPIAKPFINWRAMMVTLFFILLLSLFWEAGVGVPYQWWDYNHSQMMGIFINAFASLPIEAVIVWAFAAWTTIIVYETVHTLVYLRAGDGIAVPANPLGQRDGAQVRVTSARRPITEPPNKR